MQTGHRPDPHLAQTIKASRLSSICDTESPDTLPSSGYGHISSTGCQVCHVCTWADSPADSKGVTSRATSKSQTALPSLAQNPATLLLPVHMCPATPTDVTCDRFECSSARLKEAEDTGCHRTMSVCFRCSRQNFTLYEEMVPLGRDYIMKRVKPHGWIFFASNRGPEHSLVPLHVRIEPAACAKQKMAPLTPNLLAL